MILIEHLDLKDEKKEKEANLEGKKTNKHLFAHHYASVHALAGNKTESCRVV